MDEFDEVVLQKPKPNRSRKRPPWDDHDIDRIGVEGPQQPERLPKHALDPVSHHRIANFSADNKTQARRPLYVGEDQEHEVAGHNPLSVPLHASEIPPVADSSFTREGIRWHPPLLATDADSQTLATDCATPGENLSPLCSRHTRTEAVDPQTPLIVWVVCRFHFLLYLFISHGLPTEQGAVINHEVLELSSCFRSRFDKVCLYENKKFA